VVDLLAASEVATSAAAMGECRTKAGELEGNLDTAAWDIFEAIGKLGNDHRDTVEQILNEVRQVLQSDEHVVPLAPALKGAQAKALRLLTEVAKPRDVVPPPPPTPPPKPGVAIVETGREQNLNREALSARLLQLDKKVRPGQTIRFDVSWIIEEGGSPS
jgi:hypothetical protein